jgi:hypothetical protein
MRLDLPIFIAAAVAFVADVLSVGVVVWRVARWLYRKQRVAPMDDS